MSPSSHHVPTASTPTGREPPPNDELPTVAPSHDPRPCRMTWRRGSRPAGGGEPRSIGGCIDAVPAALEVEVCPAHVREPSAAWVFPSHRGGKGCRPGREEAVVLHVRDAGLDVGGDLRANRMECGAARQADECERPHEAR